VSLNHAGRQNLDRLLQRGGGQPMNVLSGLDPKARTLYVSVQTHGGTDDDARVDFELRGTRWGFDFVRRFSLAPGQTVAVNADGMAGARLDVVASSVAINVGGQAVASWSPNARDVADDVTAWWIDQYAATPAVIRVPDGASRLAVFTAATSLEWIMYDGAGVERAIPGPAVPGAVGEVLGTHFRAGAAFTGAFEIRL
jgi:hypothetical protein